MPRAKIGSSTKIGASWPLVKKDVVAGIFLCKSKYLWPLGLFCCPFVLLKSQPNCDWCFFADWCMVQLVSQVQLSTGCSCHALSWLELNMPRKLQSVKLNERHVSSGRFQSPPSFFNRIALRVIYIIKRTDWKTYPRKFISSCVIC